MHIKELHINFNLSCIDTDDDIACMCCSIYVARLFHTWWWERTCFCCNHGITWSYKNRKYDKHWNSYWVEISSTTQIKCVKTLHNFEWGRPLPRICRLLLNEFESDCKTDISLITWLHKPSNFLRYASLWSFDYGAVLSVNRMEHIEEAQKLLKITFGLKLRSDMFVIEPFLDMKKIKKLLD